MFCVDANVLMQAHRVLYPQDIAPGFWEAIAGAIEKEQVFVVHEVYREIVLGKDLLATWVKARKATIMRDQREDRKVIRELNRIDEGLKKVQPNFKPAVVNKFYEGADPWVVAYSAAYDHVVVTQEVAEPLRRKNVKIPDVCALPEVSVRCISTLELLRELGVRMVLG